MPLGQPVGALVELACLVLGGLVLLRIAVRAISRGAARAARSGADAAARAGRALRPGLARRLVASVLGLSAPAVAVAPACAASASPVAPLVPDRARATALGPVRATELPDTVLPDADRAAARAAYVVRAGDTLWDIARRHLPRDASAAHVAREWPRWYAANRGVIGADPSLIVPGQHLLAPGRRSAGTPTQPHAAPAPTTGTPVPPALSLDPDRR